MNVNCTKGLLLLVGEPMAWVYLLRMYSVARNVQLMRGGVKLTPQQLAPQKIREKILKSNKKKTV